MNKAEVTKVDNPTEVAKNEKNKGMNLLVLLSIIIPIVILAPLIISWGLDCSWFSYARGQVEAWVGFWGSYLGGIIGMFAVIITTYFLINNQNKHHNEQLEQQREDIVKSINSAVQLEREKFMVQFNIEKYEKALLLLLKLDNKIEIYLKKYNEAETFIMESVNHKINSPIIIDKELYKIYLDTIKEVDDQIREILQELTALEKIVSFGFEIIYESSIYQYLIVVSNNASLLNTTAREETILSRRIDDLRCNTRSAIKSCEDKVHSCIEQELLKYRPKE